MVIDLSGFFANSPVEIKVLRFKRNDYFRLRRQKVRKITFDSLTTIHNWSIDAEQLEPTGTECVND